jgi:hypothetical protein
MARKTKQQQNNADLSRIAACEILRWDGLETGAEYRIMADEIGARIVRAVMRAQKRRGMLRDRPDAG